MRYGLIHAASGTVLETCSSGKPLAEMKNRCEILNKGKNGEEIYYVAILCEYCEVTPAQLKEHRGIHVFRLCLKCSHKDTWDLEEVINHLPPFPIDIPIHIRRPKKQAYAIVPYKETTAPKSNHPRSGDD